MANVNDIPVSDVMNLQPQGSSAPPSGQRMMTFDTPYGRRTVYMPMWMSPDEALAGFNQHIMPQLENERQQSLEASAKSNAAQADTTIFLPGMGAVMIPGKYVIAAGSGFDKLVQNTKQILGMGGADQDAQIKANAQQMDRFFDVFPEAKVAQAVGENAPVAAASFALTPAAALATPAKQMLNAMVQGGAVGGFQYVPPGGSRVQNALEGAKNAALMQAPFSVAARIAQGPTNILTPPQSAAVGDMSSIPGMQPFPSQLTGSPVLQGAEKIASFFPFAGGQIASRAAANRQAVNAQVLDILGAPAGTNAGMPDVLTAIKNNATGLMDKAENSGYSVQLNPDKISQLDAIRTAELGTNSPDAQLVGTINKLIGDASPGLLPHIAKMGPQQQAQAISLYGKDAFRSAGMPLYPDGLPMPFFTSVQSDLSELSANGVHLAGQANKVLTDAAVETLPNGLGTDLQTGRQQFGALKVAKNSFDPATGNVDLGKLTTALSGGDSAGPDVVRFLDSSNPRLIDLANTANTARGVPPLPPSGSDTAQKMTLLHWLGLGGELGAAAAAGLGTGMLSGGDVMATAAGGILPLLFANYGTKAYLSPTFASYAQQGLPTLGAMARATAPYVGAAVPAIAGSSAGQ
jgi:hypothetical protein